MVMKSCDTNVDKVALIARWLVIHTKKMTNIYTIKYTKYVFVVFIVRKRKYNLKLGDYLVGMDGSKSRNN